MSRNFHYAFPATILYRQMSLLRSFSAFVPEPRNRTCRQGLCQNQKAMICPISKQFFRHLSLFCAVLIPHSFRGCKSIETRSHLQNSKRSASSVSLIPASQTRVHETVAPASRPAVAWTSRSTLVSYQSPTIFADPRKMKRVAAIR